MTTSEDLESAPDYTSDFNEAKSQLFRLHNLYLDCRNYTKKGDLIAFKWALEDIWTELCPDARVLGGKDDLGPTKDNKYFTEIERLNKDIASAGVDRDKLYQSLLNKYRFLRFLQDDAGKGSKRSPTDEDEFD